MLVGVEPPLLDQGLRFLWVWPRAGQPPRWGNRKENVSMLDSIDIFYENSLEIQFILYPELSHKVTCYCWWGLLLLVKNTMPLKSCFGENRGFGACLWEGPLWCLPAQRPVFSVNVGPKMLLSSQLGPRLWCRAAQWLSSPFFASGFKFWNNLSTQQF